MSAKAKNQPYGFEVTCQLTESAAKKAGKAEWVFPYRNCRAYDQAQHVLFSQRTNSGAHSGSGGNPIIDQDDDPAADHPDARN